MNNNAKMDAEKGAKSMPEGFRNACQNRWEIIQNDFEIHEESIKSREKGGLGMPGPIFRGFGVPGRLWDALWTLWAIRG